MSSQMRTIEASFKAPAARMFKAMDHWHQLGPKGASEHINDANLEQMFGPGATFPHIKHRLDVVDHQNYEVKGVVLEGGDLGTKFESFAFHYKGHPTADGGCVIKLTTTATARPGVDVSEAIAQANEGATLMLKAAEAHILSSPSNYA